MLLHVLKVDLIGVTIIVVLLMRISVVPNKLVLMVHLDANMVVILECVHLLSVLLYHVMITVFVKWENQFCIVILYLSL